MIFHAVNSIIKRHRNRKLFEGRCTDGSKKLLQKILKIDNQTVSKHKENTENELIDGQKTVVL